MTNPPARYLAAAAALIVLAAVVAGLVVIGSPGAARRLQADQRRIVHLKQISSAVNLHWTRHHRIPASLTELTRDTQAELPQEDPSIGEAYEYRIVDGRKYEICARFQVASDPLPSGDFWRHGAGRQCFQIEAEEVRP